MYKRLLFINIIIFFAVFTEKNCYAQTIDELIEQSCQTYDIYNTKAEEYAMEALSIALDKKDEKSIYKVYVQLVRINFLKGDIKKAVEYATIAENGYIEINDEHSLASLYDIWANGYFYIGENEMFNIYSDKSIKMAIASDNKNALVNQYYMKGMEAYHTNDILTATEYLNKTLFIILNNKNFEPLIFKCYDLLGDIYTGMESFDKALEYVKQSAHYSESLKMYRDMGNCYAKLAHIYCMLKDYDSAYIECHKSLNSFRTAQLESMESVAYSSFAKYFMCHEQYDSAKYYISKAIDITENYQQKKTSISFYSEAGEIFYKSGDYEMALYYAREANILAIESNIPLLIRKSQRLIGDVYYGMKHYDFAAVYYNQYLEGDTLKTFEKVQQEILKLSELRIKEQTENTLKGAQTKRKILSYFLMGCIVLICLLTLLIRKISLQRNKINYINGELNEYKDELELLIEYKSKQLDDKEQQYFNLCNNMFNGAVFRMEFDEKDIPNGRIVFVSSGWKNLTGQQEDTTLFFDNNLFPADRERLSRAIEKAVKIGSVLDETFRYHTNDDISWFHVRAVATKPHDNSSVYVDGYVVDETEEKRFEEQLVDAKEKAEESDRLKSAFLNNISHEIRTPMNAIMGFSSLLMKNQIPESEKEVFLNAINENCFQLLQIINDIVELSKIETNQTKIYYNDTTIVEVEEDIKLWIFPVYEERYPHVDFRINESFGKYSTQKFITDKIKLGRIFEYLIDNAAKFTREGYVEVGVIPEKNKFHFYVKDTGIGIAKENFETIFNNFIKLNPLLKTGTGLGLSITKRLINKLGGKIWLESEQNVGTTFHFTISATK